MLFVTSTFVIFFLLVYIGHSLLESNRVNWQRWMLLSSIVFYTWWDSRLIIVLLGVCVGTWAAGIWINRLRILSETCYYGSNLTNTTTNKGIIYQQSFTEPAVPESAHNRYARKMKQALGFSILMIILVILISRYLPFLANNINLLTPWTTFAFTPPDLPLVLGMSFISFEAISYLVDVKRGQVANRSLREVSLFLSFFPHLAAGPILRSKDFFNQINKPTKPILKSPAIAGSFILAGVFKKVVLGEILLRGITPVRLNPSAYSGLDNLITLLVGPLRVFADISAYSDIAIGLALLVGITFPDNFRKPYASDSLLKFWHRWHITVSAFFRDYVYEPLRGHSTGVRMALAAVATFLLSGLWHGPTWSFILWGGLNGIGVVVEGFFRLRRLKAGRKRQRSRSIKVLKTATVYLFIATTGLLFSSLPIDSSFTLLSTITNFSWSGWTSSAILTPGFILATCIVVCIQFTKPHLGRGLANKISYWPAPLQGILFGALLTAILALAGSGVSLFIYYRF